MSNQQVEEGVQEKVENPRVKSIKDFYKRLAKNKAALIGFYTILFLIVVSIIGPLLTSNHPNDTDVMNRFEGPSAEFWFGTDHMGRDIFTRIIHGMSLTLGIGFASVIMGALVGIPIGIISGYYGGRIDNIIMRFIDILLAFPGILLALAIVSILGGSLVNVTIAVAIYAVPGFARIIRGSTLAAKKLEYVDAIRALGAGDGRIIFKHILPNVLSPVIVNATLYIATAILTAAGLSFLGMGAQPPTPEWGAMLNDGRGYMRDAGYIAFFPGAFIVVVVLAFNIFGDGLRDALDPKMKK
ncbi:ABC transporter permease [Alkalibacillus haloalkaliphilus]|uniref:Peptide ABC transporter substrate-binding protein n=1 Tax=Alkalibacillus haloalkaliphilus TaxID=94136 RepID=A0A511VZU8_9BACI|nr:ABC transporter permease [Alkalibacillus haloalkaliphilus]MDV2581297.1 ABC transporter permease [Alkalibacillus haloalkaliphilus]GEN44359.1 peptide ABC transporter substrate-binding protein [Alkalibacillus haloalkaliphilus]